MCRFASGILTKTSVLWLQDSDSHSEILEVNHLSDSTGKPDFVKYELIPPNGDNWDDFEKWQFHIDQDATPNWFNTAQDESRARSALAKRFPDGFKKGLKVKGHLNLSRLTSLPANVKLSVGGYLYLRSLKGKIPAGVVAGGRIIR